MISTDTAQIDARRGRLFRLKVERNAASRQAALDSIHEFPARVTVRLGGRMRGQTVVCTSRRDAEQRVHRYYRAALWQFVMRQNGIDSDDTNV